MPLSYDKTFSVFHYECDPWGRMCPGDALRRAQEVSIDHCTSLGFDTAYYDRTHSAFLLSKMCLDIFSMPRHEQTVRIETVAYGLEHAVFHRKTTLYSEAGEVFCAADSRWVLVDTQSRRILRKPPEEVLDAFGHEECELGPDIRVKKPGAPLSPLQEVRAGYTLCDSNGHINNTRYLDLMLGQLPLERLERQLPGKILLSYRSEIRLGDTFQLTGLQTDDNCYFFAAEKDGKHNFEGIVCF